jgi:hypothetical protein
MENEPLQIHKKTSQWLQYIFYWKYLMKRERTKCFKQGWGHKVDVWWFMTWPCGWSHMVDVWLFHDMTLWLRSQGRCVIFFWHYPVDEVTRLPYGWSRVCFWLFNTTFNDMTVISTILCQFYIWNLTKTINICGYGLWVFKATFNNISDISCEPVNFIWKRWVLCNNRESLTCPRSLTWSYIVSTPLHM